MIVFFKIVLFRAAFSVFGSFFAYNKLKLMIFRFNPQYPSLAQCSMMLEIFFQQT